MHKACTFQVTNCEIPTVKKVVQPLINVLRRSLIKHNHSDKFVLKRNGNGRFLLQIMVAKVAYNILCSLYVHITNSGIYKTRSTYIANKFLHLK